MKKFVSLIVITFALSLFVFPLRVSAQETINSFHVDMTALKNGDLQVSEKIDYDFGSAERHGIYRYIPLVSKVGDLYRTIDITFTNVLQDGQHVSYGVGRSGQQEQLKIGTASKTITGAHSYEIDYTVSNGIGSNYADHDEIYWNVTGNGWQVPIASASYTLTTDVGVPIQKAVCYTGESGSTASNCQVSISSDAKSLDVTATSPLGEYEGLTVVAAFPVGTFPKSVLQSAPPVQPGLVIFLIIVGIVWVLLNLGLAPYLVFWYIRKRDKKKFGPPMVNFDLPKAPDGTRISPSEAGTIDNTRLERDDIVATIYDLAIRKYLQITGTIRKGVLGMGERQDFTLTRLKDNGGLNEFERYLMERLFGGKTTTTLEDAKLTYTTFSTLEKTNFTSLISRGFYTKDPKNQKSFCLIMGLIALFTGSIILGPVLLFLARKLNGRTELGDEMDWKLDGLKIFLKATKRYDVWQTKNFIFIESMIPYAMALGVIEQYMKELQILNPDYKPSWYTGYGTFYAMYPAFTSSASSNVTTSAPSTSSGFSGGFSGGGGGGGGGGSW
ncbi:MAG TPA: DUF2207 domain-containing protein [Patescibacteria group bacterium]|nr:DUF2207 domain-containing protein [Patescibacteria group bacterium]